MSKPKLPESIGGIRIVPCEPIRLTERQQRLLGELWDWQRSSANSDYIFTDKPDPRPVCRIGD